MELLNLKELDGTAVEEIVAKPMSKLHAEQMSEELTKLYLNLLMVDPDYRVPQIEEEFLFRMITSRLECYQFTLDFRTKVILMYVAQSPGAVVMYLTYIQYLVKTKYPELRNTEISIDTISMKLFPMGFFSQHQLQIIWDKQKIMRPEGFGGSDNLLDYYDKYKSIFL